MDEIELTNKIQDKVLDYLVTNELDTKNHMVVLMEAKQSIWLSGEVPEERLLQNCVDMAQSLYDSATKTITDPATGSVIKAASEEQINQASNRLAKAEAAYVKGYNKFISTKATELGTYFSKQQYEVAQRRVIDSDLAQCITPYHYDAETIDRNLKTLGEQYGWDETSENVFFAFLCQVRRRLESLKDKNGNVSIVNYEPNRNDYGIMPSFYGKQGCGKSVLADIVCKTITGSVSSHGIDEIIGSFGTLDVFKRPVIVMNEFGRQDKNSTDELKKYINGEIVTVNQKYRNPVTQNCFSSFILTSNFDPTLLNGQEIGSRRICVVKFNNGMDFKYTIEDIENAVRALWGATSPDAFELLFGRKTALRDFVMSNHKSQEDDSVVDWILGLTDEQIEVLGGRKSCSKLYNLLGGRFLSRNKLKAYLETDFFDRYETAGRHYVYSPSAKFYKLLEENT